MNIMWYVYILLCADKTLYTGITNNLGKRVLDHINGKGGKYTRSHKPIKLVYQEEHSTKSAALKREFEIKSFSKEDKIKLLGLVYS